MSNKPYYLATGQECTLIEKRPDGKFLVDPHYYFDEYNEQEYETIYSKPSNTLIIVDKIFNVPPIEVIDEDFKKLQSEIALKRAELNSIKDEVKGLIRQKEIAEKDATSLDRWKIDLSQFKKATTIHCFVKDDLYPTLIGRDDFSGGYGHSLYFEVKFTETHDRRFYNGWFGRKSGGEFTLRDIDETIGFLFDISDEELTRITLERNEKADLSKYNNLRSFSNVEEKYYTEAMRTRYNEIQVDENEASQQRLRNEIFKKEEELKALQSALIVN